jgi:hypothetical protein
MLHQETGLRLGALEEGLSGLMARIDDLYARHDWLAGQVNNLTLASYQPPPRRPAPPEDIPPPPATGHQSGWVKDVLGGMSDDDPMPESPQTPQDGQENEQASDHVQDMNAVREPQTAPEPANQHTTFEEHRHIAVEDRWAKPFARYQIALQAVNGSVRAKRRLSGAAERRSMSIDDLARQIIDEWDQIEQQIMAEY